MCAAFTSEAYPGLISQPSPAQPGMFTQYAGPDGDFDLIVVGSGMGGGILADELADRLGDSRRILVIEAGSYLFPTHVYNVTRQPNAAVASRFKVANFTQTSGENDRLYIHEQPQINFGGRSIFWSGLIPTLQPWELGFFPPAVSADLAVRLAPAGEAMNASRTLGAHARQVVARLRASRLAEHFLVEETPRALHQPYLRPDGAPAADFFRESSGVFNTAELLGNQLGSRAHAGPQGLNLVLNHYADRVVPRPDGRYEVHCSDTLGPATAPDRVFTARRVVLAAGSLESPKIIRRSPVHAALPPGSRALVGRGLTDHPTTDAVEAFVTHLGDLPLPRDSHAKIVLYSRGLEEWAGGHRISRVRFPFNVEINLNHEYWHLRENDPASPHTPITPHGDSRLSVKFSFGNCLDDGNSLRFDAAGAPPFRPPVDFRNLHWLDALADDRFPALAEWRKSYAEIFWVLNEVTGWVFDSFRRHSQPVRSENGWFGQGLGFGRGTVHHAVGTLRMRAKPAIHAPFAPASVVDDNLQVIGHPGLHVCDMSVMPFSSAANPVRTLAALSLRLADHLRATGL